MGAYICCFPDCDGAALRAHCCCCQERNRARRRSLDLSPRLQPDAWRRYWPYNLRYNILHDHYGSRRL